MTQPAKPNILQSLGLIAFGAMLTFTGQYYIRTISHPELISSAQVLQSYPDGEDKLSTSLVIEIESSENKKVKDVRLSMPFKAKGRFFPVGVDPVDFDLTSAAPVQGVALHNIGAGDIVKVIIWPENNVGERYKEIYISHSEGISRPNWLNDNTDIPVPKPIFVAGVLVIIIALVALCAAIVLKRRNGAPKPKETSVT